MKKSVRPCSIRPSRSKALAAFLLAPLCLNACTAANTQAKVAAPSFDNVEKVIDEMLAEERRALRARSPSPANSPPSVAMPEATSRDVYPDASSRSNSSGDTFSEDVLRIQEVVPTWNNGTGVALKFLRETSGKRVSLIYVDPTAPEFKPSTGRWMIQATARTEKETLGHFVLLLKTLEPGRYTGSANEDSVIMSTSMGNDWNGEDPDTTWSVNEESWCEIVLEEGKNPSVLEGHFRGKLVDNEGTGFHRIESGYLFIKR